MGEPWPDDLIEKATVTFTVPGLPAPQGSKKAFRAPKSGKILITENSKFVGPWRDRVALAAHMVWNGAPVLTEVPVKVRVEYVLKRATGTPKTRPTPPAIKNNGDIDKLDRAIFDAITGVIIADDKLVIESHSTKRIAEIGEATGAVITIEELPWPR